MMIHAKAVPLLVLSAGSTQVPNWTKEEIKG
jgi:hypothetical protein